MIARGALTASILFAISLVAQAAPPVETGNAATATILCYHIVEAPAAPRMHIDRATFRQHLRYLEMTGYNVIPLRHLHEYVIGKRKSIPENAVVITFDDGWRSTYTEAFPELQRRGFPFTVFIYPNIIGQTSNALTWNQIRQMADAGVDIQSHSLSHAYLSRKQHRGKSASAYSQWLQRELLESRKVLEKQVGRKVQYLAYPYGDYDQQVADAAAQAGYSAALTCEFGPVRKGSDPLRMRRFVIDDRMDFAAFRKYLGTTPMQLAEMTPKPGIAVEDAIRTISAKIANHKALDPRSVGMAVLSLGRTVPYSYDATTGAISVKIQQNVEELRSKALRAIVWGRDKKSGKRVEATWTLRVAPPPAPAPPPEQPLPVVVPTIATSPAAPAAGAMNR